MHIDCSRWEGIEDYIGRAFESVAETEVEAVGLGYKREDRNNV